MVVRARWLRGPSGSSVFMWRWGITTSSSSRNRIPAQKPTTAGTKAKFPSPALSSRAGIKRLQMDAATMTPAAKPVSPRWTFRWSCSFIKYTQPAPRLVPAKGIRIPFQTSGLIIIHLLQIKSFPSMVMARLLRAYWISFSGWTARAISVVSTFRSFFFMYFPVSFR